jgi:uncharacterized membrane protein YkoI
MPILRIRSAALAATIVVAALAAPALAAAGEAQEQTALMNSRVTLSQAVATAEQQTGGKAYDAGVDVDHGKPRVVVETNGANGVQTVVVDAATGQVVSTHAGGVAD